MIIVTITHHVRDGLIEAARRRIGENTVQMSRQPGFVFRHTGTPPGEPRRIVTLTAWASETDMARWDAAKRASAAGESGASVYERVERSIVEIDDERWGNVEGRRFQATS
mgnify:CR=1 FL=1